MVFALQKKYKYQAEVRHTELITEVLAGNQKSATELYALLVPFIKSVIHNKIFKIDADEVQILAHDLISHIFEKLPLYNKNKSNLIAWSGRIANNKLVDWHRRKKDVVSLHQFTNENEEYPVVIVHTNATPESILIDREKYKRLVKILMDLPEEKRRLILSYSEGKTIKELSLIYGRNRGAVTVEICRIKKLIKNQLFLFENYPIKK
jgi:RNA polymerase sigma factor (sigma-70 family)